jgi:hypothetical protein
VTESLCTRVIIWVIIILKHMILGGFSLGMKVLAWNVDSNGIENKNTIMYINTLLVSKNVKPSLLILPRYKKKTATRSTLLSTYTYCLHFRLFNNSKGIGFCAIMQIGEQEKPYLWIAGDMASQGLCNGLVAEADAHCLHFLLI